MTPAESRAHAGLKSLDDALGSRVRAAEALLALRMRAAALVEEGKIDDALALIEDVQRTFAADGPRASTPHNER